MAALFADHPEVLAETARVAEGCEFDFEKRYFLPQYPRAPEFASDNDLLVHLARAGAAVRYGDPLPRAVQERLDYELGVISHTGYAGYFLIVYDIVKAAKDRGIPVGPGRGSAAGSLVAYALGITDIEPLTFDLLFERFLNPERVSMPDIDLDFCFERGARSSSTCGSATAANRWARSSPSGPSRRAPRSATWRARCGSSPARSTGSRSSSRRAPASRSRWPMHRSGRRNCGSWPATTSACARCSSWAPASRGSRDTPRCTPRAS